MDAGLISQSLRRPDKYRCFAELAEVEQEGVDYRVIVLPKSSPALILAPHAGKIEYGATHIARSVAGGLYSLYCFEGVKRSGNWDLHITSTRFDEPRAIAMASKADIVVSIHGCGDYDSAAIVEVGGLDTALREGIEHALRANGFNARYGRRFLARDSENICNRGRMSGGAQIEAPSALRRALTQDAILLERFAGAIRGAIEYRIEELRLPTRIDPTPISTQRQALLGPSSPE